MTRPCFMFAALALLAAGCGKDIGDPCSTNLDCQSDGTRDCDLSQPGGYCTINGCDELACPSEAVCIRIFSYLPPRPTCTPDKPDKPCPSDQICLPDLPEAPDFYGGKCVPRATERRYCEKSCSNNGDCRSGYVCRQAGIEGYASSVATYGSIALVANANQSTVLKFCAPGP